MTPAQHTVSTLSFEQVKNIVADCRYRPGWTFTVYGALPDPEHPMLLIDGVVPDAYDHAKTSNIGVRVAMPRDFQTRKEVLDWLLWCLQRIEIHECREFFQVRDKSVDPFGPRFEPWSNPHA